MVVVPAPRGLRRLHGRQEPYVARVAMRHADNVGRAAQTTGARGEVGEGEGEQDTRTGANPEQVLAGQQGSDPEARRFVLSDYVITC